MNHVRVHPTSSVTTHKEHFLTVGQVGDERVSFDFRRMPGDGGHCVPTFALSASALAEMLAGSNLTIDLADGSIELNPVGDELEIFYRSEEIILVHRVWLAEVAVAFNMLAALTPLRMAHYS